MTEKHTSGEWKENKATIGRFELFINESPCNVPESRWEWEVCFSSDFFCSSKSGLAETKDKAKEMAASCMNEAINEMPPKKPQRDRHTSSGWHIGSGNGEGSIFANKGRIKLVNGVTTLFPICKMVAGFDETQDKANAQLIAKAPLLPEAIEALQECAHLIEYQDQHLTGIRELQERVSDLIARYEAKDG